MNLENKNYAQASSTPKEKTDQVEKKNTLPPELLPYQKEMKEWIDTHMDDISFFLRYRQAKFNIQYSQEGFYYQPNEDIINLNISDYKKAKEQGNMTTDQVLFITLHEFAHLKTMVELDRAGKINHLAHFEYEGKKVIQDKTDPAKFASLRGTYRQFYNILEDAIVNHMVLGSNLYNADIGEASQVRNLEIKKMYTDRNFPLYKKVGDGQGAHILNPDQEDAKDNPYLEVGSGQGNLQLLQQSDYENGIDWNELEGLKSRSSQLLTYFMKNQMIGLNTDQVFHPEKNPSGKHLLRPDISDVLHLPLAEMYNRLLKEIIDKYKTTSASDQAADYRWKRYLQFMTQQIDIPHHEIENRKPVITKQHTSYNVVNPGSIDNHQAYQQNQFQNVSIDLDMAQDFFTTKLEQVCRKLGYRDYENVTWLDIFNSFKEKNKFSDDPYATPLLLNLADRTQVVREVMEPIFTMLCILDDSFEVELPPEKPGEGPGKPGIKEKPEWRQGDTVIEAEIDSQGNAKPKANARKGVISAVHKSGPGGEITSVTVDFFDEVKPQESFKSFATRDFTQAKSETIYDPYNRLALYNDQPPKPPKPREDEDDDDEEEEEDPRKKIDKYPPPPPPPSQKKKAKKGKPQPNEQPKPEDQKPEDIIDPYRKALEELIKKDEREDNLGELEEQKQTPDYQKKLQQNQELEDLAEKINKPTSNPDEIRKNRELIQEYQKLEDALRPFSAKMSEAWKEIISNVTDEIKTIKDKYYFQGKADLKKVQRYFLNIQLGEEIDKKRIYEKMIEKIISDIQPKMLRVTLLIDNSGSMSSCLNEVRTSVMLLNSSLRNLRLLFKQMFKNKLGSDYRGDIDLVCDTEIWTFENGPELIKPFGIKDFKFIDNPKLPRPKLSLDEETISTIAAFKKINPDGGTDDSELWRQINSKYQDQKIKSLIGNDQITEVIFQISDGAISGNDTAIAILNKLKNNPETAKINIAGFAIGGESARQSLAERHGKNVILADTPQQIVEEFGKLLQKMIKDQVSTTIKKSLQKSIAQLEQTQKTKNNFINY